LGTTEPRHPQRDEGSSTKSTEPTKYPSKQT
jgi:hypothetical protein